ncbi:glycosyltransferase [Acuticoccus yangtzensis]|uniref:glycosyltransferase n=1 Tax=Acuticoccus yangtzensis TaxID=1443441 RepID=UPI00094996B6|nr:glycosyltransferase [Acuticoccus yangtzensis]
MPTEHCSDPRTVLILSPHFPPSSLAGVHRARHLAKALPLHGWRPVVVRADPAHTTESGDDDLARLVPARLEQVATGAIPARLTRRIGIGDIGLRGYRQFGRALEEAAERTGANVVLLTGSPFYPLLLARRLKRRGLKVVLDFQDPWVSAAGAARPALSKGGLSHRLATLLEPRAVRYADAITSVSDEQNRQMRDRYPFLANVPMEAIPIGGDPDDFDALRAAPPAALIHPLDPARLNFCYVGTFMPRSGPLMAALLSAAGRLAARRPDLAARLTLNFVGTSNQPDASGEGPATRLARELGVAHLVAETPRRVPFLEALSLLANADGLMLVGSDEPHYTASKIYPNLMAARPFVSLFHAASSAHAILTAAGGGRAFAFEDPAELGALTEPLSGALEAVADQGSGFSAPDPAAYAPFTAEAVAGRYAALFERLAG